MEIGARNATAKQTGNGMQQIKKSRMPSLLPGPKQTRSRQRSIKKNGRTPIKMSKQRSMLNGRKTTCTGSERLQREGRPRSYAQHLCGRTLRILMLFTQTPCGSKRKPDSASTLTILYRCKASMFAACMYQQTCKYWMGQRMKAKRTIDGLICHRACERIARAQAQERLFA